MKQAIQLLLNLITSKAERLIQKMGVRNSLLPSYALLYIDPKFLIYNMHQKHLSIFLR